jgi:hypothetical protein
LRDFTLDAYERLATDVAERYRVVTFAEFVDHPAAGPAAVLRHDVDRRIGQSVRCAEVLARHGIRGTFYFRHPYTFDPAVLLRVSALGHEVGYHYEVLSKTRGDVPQALGMFARELAEFREFAEVRTACMHGAPLSPWDNRAIWAAAELGDFGLSGEPYLSLRSRPVTYLTDTGRSWAGDRFSLRDRMEGASVAAGIRTTADLCRAARAGVLGGDLMLTFHPERWSSGALDWGWQLVSQNVKNVAKAGLKAVRR